MDRYNRADRLLARLRAGKAEAVIPRSLRGGALLDIGCGRIPFFLQKRVFARQIGADRLPPDGSPGVPWVLVDLDDPGDLPFRDASFDCVTMLAVLEHVAPSRVRPVLDDVHRVLRPGGALVMTTPSPWTEPLLHALGALRIISHESVDEHQSTWGLPALRRLFASTEFGPGPVRLGYFEVGMNTWAMARKSAQGGAGRRPAAVGAGASTG